MRCEMYIQGRLTGIEEIISFHSASELSLKDTTVMPN